MSRAIGAKVIALTTSEDKIDLLRKLGASHVINSKVDKKWADQVLKFTDGRGADHLLEVIGAATIKESLRAVRQAGVVSVVGFLSESEKHDLIPDIVFGAKTSKLVESPKTFLEVASLTHVSSVRGLMNGSLGMLQDMSKFVEHHKIHPVIAEVFGWQNAKDAYKALIEQKFVGKLVIKID